MVAQPRVGAHRVNRPLIAHIDDDVALRELGNDGVALRMPRDVEIVGVLVTSCDGGKYQWRISKGYRVASGKRLAPGDVIIQVWQFSQQDRRVHLVEPRVIAVFLGVV